jgi:hypothetical protein
MKFQEINYQPKPLNIPKEQTTPLLLMLCVLQLRLHKQQVTNISKYISQDNKRVESPKNKGLDIKQLYR